MSIEDVHIHTDPWSGVITLVVHRDGQTITSLTLTTDEAERLACQLCAAAETLIGIQEAPGHLPIFRN